MYVLYVHVYSDDVRRILHSENVCKLLCTEACYQYVLSGLVSIYCYVRMYVMCICVYVLGAEGTKISPVIDGFELRTASIYTERGGNRFDALLRQRIEARNLCALSPWFDTSYIRERNPG